MAIDDTKLSLCKKIYIEHDGRHHGEIQRLMRREIDGLANYVILNPFFAGKIRPETPSKL